MRWLVFGAPLTSSRSCAYISSLPLPPSTFSLLLSSFLLPPFAFPQGFPTATTYTPAEVGQPLVIFDRTRLVENGPGTADDQVIVGGGRAAILAYVGDHSDGYLISVPEVPDSLTGSHLQARFWDLDTLTDVAFEPQEFFSTTDPQNLGVTTGFSGVLAHGYAKRGEYLLSGSYAIRILPGGPVAGVLESELSGIPMFRRGNTFHPWYVTEWWSYSAVAGDLVLSLDGNTLSSTDHLGNTGVIGHPFIIGDLLIMASDQSRTGVATYDISDPTSPQLLDVLTFGGAGGYWPEVWGGDGSLLILFPFRTNGNGIRIVDATDPTNLRFIAETPLSGDQCMYAQFQDEYAFVGQHKVSMQTFESVLELDTAGTATALAADIDTSQFALPLGQYVVTGGVAQGQAIAIFPHQETPDTRAPSVGYHRPLAGQTNVSRRTPISILIHETLDTRTITPANLIVRTAGGAPLDHAELTINFTFDDILQIHRDALWDAGTTYEVVFTDGGIRDVSGNGIEGYSFAFSTIGGVGAPNLPPVISDFSISSGHPTAPGATASFSLTASDPDALVGDSLQFRYQSGDGSPWSAWGTSTTPSFTYADPGHFTAKAQVREILAPSDTPGAITTRIIRVTVTAANPADPAPASSSPITCDPARRLLWTANPDNNTVHRRHIDSNASQEIPVSADPRNIAIDATGRAWVTCHDADRIDLITPAGAASSPPSLDLGYGAAPHGIVMSPDGLTAYVSTTGSGTLRRFNTSTLAEISAPLPLGPRARALAISADGSELYVSRFISAENHAEVWQVDTAAFTLTRTLVLPRLSGQQGFADTTASGVGVLNYLAGLAIAPDPDGAGPASRRLLVASKLDNTNRGLLTGIFNDLDQDNTVRTLVSRVDLGTGAIIDALDIDNSDSASSITFSPLRDYFFVTLQGTNSLVIFDNLSIEAASGLGSFVTRVATGLAPQGACFDPITSQLFTKNFLSRSTSDLDLSAFLATGAISIPVANTATVATEALAPDVLLGKQIFYNAADTRMSAEGYISCATCHVDGDHDGRTWDFTGRNEGLRNTTDLRGRGGSTQGNVHWSGNFDEIQDFEHDIRGPFGGSGFLSAAEFASANTTLGTPKAGLNSDLDALAAYVSSLGHDTVPHSPHRQPDGALTPDASAGQAIFESLNCASCHGGPELTISDNFLLDVGTLRDTSGDRLDEHLPGIDPPTLRGLWTGAPYFHNGSAPTLEAVFTHTGGRVYPAEDGTPGGGATIAGWDPDNSSRLDRINFSIAGNTHTMSNLDGGSGGQGALTIRYSTNRFPDSCELRINGGAPITVSFPGINHGVSFERVSFSEVRIETGVIWTAGPTNSIELSVTTFTGLNFDEFVVSTPEDLARAQPHRQVAHLATPDREALLTFLRQLDGTPYTPPVPTEPLLTIAAANGQPSPFIADSAIFDIRSDRPLIGLTAADFVLGGAANPLGLSFSQLSASHWQVTVLGYSNAGAIELSLPAAAAQDGAGADTPAAGPASITYASPYLETDDLAALSDEFDADSTGDWLRNYDAEGWTVAADKLEAWDVDSTAPGHMYILPGTGANFDRHVGPIIYKDITGDFVATVQVSLSRRDGAPGQPDGDHDFTGLLVRQQKDYPNGALADWVAGTEDWLSYAVGRANVGPQWSLSVNSTRFGAGDFYTNHAQPSGDVTLQIIRIDDTFVFLHRFAGGDWIVQDRVLRADLPDTLQVGIFAQSDFDNVVRTSNNIWGAAGDVFRHNSTAISAANGFIVDPTARIDSDYLRYHRPSPLITRALLNSVPISEESTPVLLADTALAPYLGAAGGFPERNLSILPPAPLYYGAPASFSLQLDPVDPTGLEFRWNFGDGTQTDWSAGSQTVSHTFASAGNFTITAEARDGLVGLHSSTLVVNIDQALRGATVIRFR